MKARIVTQILMLFVLSVGYVAIMGAACEKTTECTEAGQSCEIGRATGVCVQDGDNWFCQTR